MKPAMAATCIYSVDIEMYEEIFRKRETNLNLLCCESLFYLQTHN